MKRTAGIALIFLLIAVRPAAAQLTLDFACIVQMNFAYAPSPTPTITPAPAPTPTPDPNVPQPFFLLGSGDYNGNGTSDIALFRKLTGLWAIRGVTRSYFGGSTDEPVPGDYDGDTTEEIGIFRATSGLWAIKAVTRAYFGGVGDIPVGR